MKFSIITCTYNSEKFVEKNINSVLQQNFSNYEHIIIDGFSSDKTISILNRYKNKKVNDVKIFQCIAKGISNAMNEGIKRAKGEYIIHLHSDDSFYDSNVLNDANNFLKESDFDWVYGKINVIEQDGKNIGIFPLRKIFQISSLSKFKKYIYRYYNFIPHQGVFIRKNVFDNFGYFDESISSAMDMDLWYRIISKTRWAFFNRIVSNYCLRSGSESSSVNNKDRNNLNIRIVRKRFLNFLEYYIARLVDFYIEKRKSNYR